MVTAMCAMSVIRALLVVILLREYEIIFILIIFTDNTNSYDSVQQIETIVHIYQETNSQTAPSL